LYRKQPKELKTTSVHEYLKEQVMSFSQKYGLSRTTSTMDNDFISIYNLSPKKQQKYYLPSVKNKWR